MPCQLVFDGRPHTGLVLDLSPSGLFIQTSAKAKAGVRMELMVTQREGDPLDLVVEVVRKKVVPARLMSIAQGGVGVRVISAPEDYYTLLTELDIGEGPREAEAKENPLPRFRVRVSQLAGPRSRRVELNADDAERAGELALEELGEGWKVLDVETL